MKIAFYYIIKEITKSEYNFMKTTYVLYYTSICIYIHVICLLFKIKIIFYIKSKRENKYNFYILYF